MEDKAIEELMDMLENRGMAEIHNRTTCAAIIKQRFDRAELILPNKDHLYAKGFNKSSGREWVDGTTLTEVYRIAWSECSEHIKSLIK